MRMNKKIYSLPNRYVTYIKTKADQYEIGESDMLRRLLDKLMEQEKKENADTKSL